MNISTTDRPEQLKALIWKVTENKRAIFQSYGEKQFKRALNAQFAPFIKELLRSGVMQYDLIGTRPMEDSFINVYGRVGAYFASETYGQITKSYHPKYDIKKRRRRRFVNAAEADLLESKWLQYMKRFALTEAGARITKITETTREIVRRSLDKSITEGLGIDKAARRLIKEWKNLTSNRAKLIARTEIISGSNAGSFIGAQSTGLNLEKEWLATRDSRTRDSHIHADGDKARMDEPFPNGLRYPGDPEGSAAQVINCRCTIVYNVLD